MLIFPELFESLRFLLIDLQKQLQAINDAIVESDSQLLHKSLQRIDYIENAHLNLLNRSFKAREQEHPQLRQSTIQGYEHISYSLKNLSSQLEAIAYQLLKNRTLKHLSKKRVFKALDDLNKGLSLIEPALQSQDLKLAIDICQLQVRIDKHCQQQLQRFQEQISDCDNIHSMLNSSFILKDIQHMANTLLKVGEGILSGKLGQSIQIDRFQTLEATLSELSGDVAAEQINIHSMGETKSGCTISGVTSATEAQEEILAIFKEGQKDKLREEKEGIESWHKKFPGIAPEVYSYQRQGDKAALLFEYLTGQTFEKLLLEDRELLQQGLNQLFVTLREIWQTTQQKQRIPANFMTQMQKRLKGIYAVHPQFNSKGLRLGEAKQASLESLVKQAMKLEANLKSPKAVYIHGDFNVDNILYDPDDNDINFIDLHRSEYQDYVQDLSVLMVSFYRLKQYDPKIRQSIRLTMEAIYDFGLDYAASINDKDYAQRMALGLARSFITSTRFVLDHEHAKTMLFKGRYLLEQLIQRSNNNNKEPYQLPKELLRD